METLKEVIVELFILLAGLIIVTAEGVVTHAKGLSCDQDRIEARAATPEEADPIPSL